MKAYISVAKLFAVLFLVINTIDGVAQEYLKEVSKCTLTPSMNDVSGSLLFPKKSIVFGNEYKIQSAKVKVQVDLLSGNEEYIGGSVKEGRCTASFKLDVYLKSGESVSIPVAVTPVLTELKPISVVCIDLFNNLSVQQIADIDRVCVVGLAVKDDPGSNISANVSSVAALEVEYSHAVTAVGTSLPLSSAVQINPFDKLSVLPKSVDFTWNCYFPFTMYQLQLLRLNNICNEKDDPKCKKAIDEYTIQADIDWSQAITFDFSSPNVFDGNGDLIKNRKLPISISQGTGFYIWRVRPIGSYYSGGIADSRNWGEWSSSISGATTLTKDALTGEFFYFTDPDEDKNSIYSRTFTEQNKVKEVTTYANGLNQVQQSKTYLPSNDVTLTSQTVSDYSGRAAITTLPIPTASKIDGYNAGFATSNGELYTSHNFDAKGKLSADLMDENRQLRYYNSNPDPRIPDASGVPFTQVAFYNEPSGRVKQEGAPGLLSMVRDDLSGKNVKYYYGTPSKSELVRLFGADSPDHETVEKTVKVDPNGVAVITYISEGKTIASCISFVDENSGLDKLAAVDNIQDESDLLTKNVKLDYGFLSSKRIVLLQPAAITVSYFVKSKVLEAGCSKISLDCNYLLDIIIHSVDGSDNITVCKDLVLKGDAAGNISHDFVTPVLMPGTYVVEKRLKFGDAKVNITEATGNVEGQIKPLVDLVAGMFAAIKSNDDVIEFNSKLLLLTKLVGKSGADFSSFFYRLKLKEPLEGESLTQTTTGFFKSDIYVNKVDKYRIDRLKAVGDDKYELLNDDAKDYPDAITIYSPCCEVTTSVKWIRKFDPNMKPQVKDWNGNGVLEPKNLSEVKNANAECEFLPDFEGYAMAYFDDCEELRYPNFYKYMNGWGDTPKDNVPQGTFNYMVYHMLTDNIRAYTFNSITETSKIERLKIKPIDPKFFTDEWGKEVEEITVNGVYTTKQLFECWEKQLYKLKAEAGCFSSTITVDGVDEPINMADESTNRNGGKDEVGSMISKAGNKVARLFRRYVKRKIKRKLRGQTFPPEAGSGDISVPTKEREPIDIHLVRDFLDCAGYTYVKILTPYDPAPIDGDVIDGKNYLNELKDPQPPFLYGMTVGVDPKTYFSGGYRKKLIGDGLSLDNKLDYGYYPIDTWKPMLFKAGKNGNSDTYVAEPINGPMFKRVRNPIYAFKYYEYPEEGADDFAEMEASNCYTDPNDCYQTDYRGFVQRSDAGGIAFGRCCAGNGNICFEDKSYPNIDKIGVKYEEPIYNSIAMRTKASTGTLVNDYAVTVGSNDPRYKIENVGGQYKVTAKYIVNPFENGMRVKCPYDHYAWSSGQRLMFYQLLGRHIPDLPEEKIKVIDNYFDNCKKMEKPIHWYENSSNNNFDWLIAEPELSEFYANNPDAKLKLHTFSSLNGVDKYGPNDEKVSPVEVDMIDMRNDCRSACGRRADKFRDDLVNLLKENCYDINGCKTAVGDNVIMDEDIDAIVNNFIAQCSSQCKVNTYTCVETGFRYLDESKLKSGPSEGVVVPMVYLGVGNPGGVELITGSKKDFEDDGQWDAYFYNIENDVAKLNDLPWAQSLLVNQATSWAYDLAIPSKCDSLRFYPERASVVVNADKSLVGVEGFGSGSLVRFNAVDFGLGVKEFVVNYKADNYTAGTKMQVKVVSGNTAISVGEFVISNTANKFTLGKVKVSSPITGVHDLIVEGVGPTIDGRSCTISWITLKADIGNFSNIQTFTVDPNNNSTYMERSTYFKESIEIPDATRPLKDDKVKSPAIRIDSEAK